MNPTEFAEALKILGSVYHKPFDRETTETWYAFFRTDDADIFRNAVFNLGSTMRWLPSVADLKAEIAKIENPQLQLDASHAYDAVLTAVKRHGYYDAAGAMESLDPITQRTIRLMGGWQTFCTSDQNEWQRKEFSRLYDQAADKAARQVALGELPDIWNQTKMLKGGTDETSSRE